MLPTVAERESWGYSRSICRRPHRLHVEARRCFVWESRDPQEEDVYGAKAEWWEKCITGAVEEEGSESEGCSVTSEEAREDRAAWAASSRA